MLAAIVNETVDHLLFEDPVPIWVALAALELVTLVVWRGRRTWPWAVGLAVFPLLAAATWATAYFVQTDRERIASAIAAVGAGVEAGSLKQADECLDANCRMAGAAGILIRKADLLGMARKAMQAYPIEKVRPGGIETTVAGANATTVLKTTFVFKTGESAVVGWRLQWAKRPEGWRITEVEIIGPRGLSDMVM